MMDTLAALHGSMVGLPAFSIQLASKFLPMEDTNDPKYAPGGVVSTSESDRQAVQRSEELSSFLVASGFYESVESAQTRERVLGALDYMVKRFVAGVPGGPERPGGKIFTFGSYRLGVHDRGADIDALCVVPRHVGRADFFTLFYAQLGEHAAVADLTKVEDAYVPLVKMKFHGIPIDLTFARLSVPVIRDSISLLGDAVLRAMDEKCIVSLNGSRVTDAVLSLVPRTDAFHCALRAVKLWAKRRCVYGAAYGYFGGVAYAICVARICQMYPRAAAFDLLLHFFEQFAAWRWPAPVMLRPVADPNLHLKVWDPRVYPTDRYHKMPVITPAYPAMCSTHNVTQSTAAHFTAELLRGAEIVRGLAAGGDFAPLFEPADFFRRYRLFLAVRIATHSHADFLAWCGYAESKIRVLCMKIEAVKDVAAALPFPKCFRSSTTSNASDGTNNTISPDISNKSADTNNLISNIKDTVNTSTANNTSVDPSCPSPISTKIKLINNPLTGSTSKQPLSRPVGDLEQDADKGTNNTNSHIGEMTKRHRPNEQVTNGIEHVTNTTEHVIDTTEQAPQTTEQAPQTTEQVPRTNEQTPRTTEQAPQTTEQAPQTNTPTQMPGLEIKHEEATTYEAHWFIAINAQPTPGSGNKLYIDGPIKDFLAFLNAWEKKTEAMSITIAPKKRKQVQAFIAAASEAK